MAEKFQGGEFQCLLTLLQINQDEITRYRDIEWKNAGVFIAASVAIIGFVLAYPMKAKDVPTAVMVASCVLCVAHMYFSTYAHIRYTRQRVVRERIQNALGVDKLRVNGEEIFKELRKSASRTKFRYGFGSHVLLFSLVNAVLVWYTFHLIRG